MPKPLDEILEARFAEDGRLDPAGRVSRQRVAGRHDPRAPGLGNEELERAVRKLAAGLETIERQSAGRFGEADPLDAEPIPGERRDAGSRDYVTHSLDRLEKRLEQLSRRLQQRAGAAPADASPPPPGRLSRAGEDSPRADLAEPRRAPEVPPRPERDGSDDAMRQFAALEARIEALQRGLDSNQIEPLRHELMDLLRYVEDMRRDGRSVAGAVEQVRAKLDEMETRLNATRNMAGNRLGELQDRLALLHERLGDMEAEVPAFDALRENQSAILERFDRMEGLVHRLAPSDEIIDRVEAVRRQLQAVPTQREIVRIEEHIVDLGARLEALPADVSHAPQLERIEGQLRTIAAELAEARRHGDASAAEVRQRLIELYSGLQEVAETGRTPDLSGLEEKLTGIASRLDVDRRFSGETLARLDKRLAALTAAVENQESAASAELLAGLSGKLDHLAEAVEEHGPRGVRREVEGLERKLDQLSRLVSEQADILSRPQLEPLQEGLGALQGRLDELAEGVEASSSQLGPFAQRLQDIAERLGAEAGVGGAVAERLAAIDERLAALSARGADPRAVHNQLENIVSRLELLKGRSIDPNRLADLFDRVDAAMRNGLAEERFDKIERMLEDRSPALPEAWLNRVELRLADAVSAISEERLDRLERQIAQPPSGTLPDDIVERLRDRLDSGLPALSEDQLARLEQKIDQLNRASTAGGEGLMPEDFGDLRGDIMALRRELRSLPGLGDGEANLGAVLKAISARLDRLPDQGGLSPELESKLDRVSQLLDEPQHGGAALAQVQASLKAIEERLEELRGAPAARVEGPGDADLGAVAGIAQSLSRDVGALKETAEASERKTRDALEAVQGTLEAVVKRMAYLERGGEAAPPPSGSSRAEGRAGVVPAMMALPVIPTLGASLDEAEAPPAGPSEPPVAAAEPPPVPAKPEGAREGSGGLFSRFTSSQLLKRATGGRAESFSPDIEDPDEAADQPLEPGTNAPLDSALAGAPSSDTARMSGARSKRREAVPAVLDPTADVSIARRLAPEPAGDDFLSAARRAAQAAAAEVAEAEREAEQLREASALGRLSGLMKRRRRAILAGALAVALALAALQLVRNQMNLDSGQVAALDGSEASQTVEPAAEAPISSPGIEPAPEAPQVASSAEAPAEAELAAAAPPEAPLAEPPAADAAPGAAALPPEAVEEGPTMAGQAPAPAETAALPPPPGGPALPPAGNIAPDAPAPSAAPPARPEGGAAPAAAPGLPAPIGPEKLRHAAAEGDPIAAFEVASRYAEGRGVLEDMPAAIAWYTRAAEAGLAPAQYRLGSIYEKGLGVPKDLAAAQRWYLRAAEAGNVKAMHNLAVLYAEGAGGAPDLERAAALFRKAAEHGVRDSQFNLAILHARGLGVPQDMVEAYKWFAVAASSGDAESSKRRDIIAAALSPDDLARAEQAANEFRPLPLSPEANDVVIPEGGWGEDTSRLQSETDLVALVQRLLADQGYDPGPADGVLGAKTVEAITAFQQSAGLPATGKVDAGLVAVLQEEQSG